MVSPIRILLVGAATGDTMDDDQRAACRRLGRAIHDGGHELAVCSPFEDSADVFALRGFVEAAAGGPPLGVTMHLPNDDGVRRALADLESDLGVYLPREFHQTPSVQRSPHWAYLVCQLMAVQNSSVVVALGGRHEGAMTSFLLIAESRKKVVVPVRHFGGAAEKYFERRQYDYADWPDLEPLVDPRRIEQVVGLAADRCTNPTTTLPANTQFFISHSRAQGSFADLAETVLRRRSPWVFHDLHDMEPDKGWREKVSTKLAETNVFVALWSRDYACSPWCFWEMHQALERHALGRLSIWLFHLDGTELTFPGAREHLTPSMCRGETFGQSDEQIRVMLRDRLLIEIAKLGAAS